ncbi:DUF2190 family protein [Paracoccus sanguinis]|uniref:Uncharacterized conserved protein n=1 Tax=Paracoccus sanguinis TaxID=1545044 RepID=A0A1H2SSI0_9RHOB|nr:DUF2190 family protein [Paracoccus sanguinis]SDW34550.1 Uncharacterized conserved protein [Paracoccus sanguinis]
MTSIPTLTLTIIARSPLEAGDLVGFDDQRTLAPDHPVKGMALHPADAGDPVSVVVIGAIRCRARGSIRAGQWVVSATGGSVAEAPSGAANPIGRALHAAADLATVMVVLGAAPGGSSDVVGAPTALRSALSPSAQVIHSGHSLTDAYNRLRRVHAAVFARPWEDQTFATIPGSATRWRWDNYDPAFPNPRDDMADFDSLVITERGLDVVGVAPIDHPTFLEDIFYELRFADRAVSAGAEVILWSIWPSHQWSDWQGILADYHNRFRVRADYLTWKLRQLYPGWTGRVWIAPGHRLIEHLTTQLPPGVPTFQSLFVDDIHPGEALNHGLSILVEAMLYRTAPAGWPASDRPAAMTAEQEDWFRAAAWAILQDYEPAGFGGAAGSAAVWDGHDWYPGVTTPAQLEAARFEDGVAHTGGGSAAPWPVGVPALLRWTAAEQAGPAMSGTMPTVEGGVLAFAAGASALEGAVDGSFADCEIFAAIRVPAGANANEPFVALAATAGAMWWNGAYQGLLYNGWVNGWQCRTSSGGVVAEAYLSNSTASWEVTSVRFEAHSPSIHVGTRMASAAFAGPGFTPAVLRIGHEGLPRVEVAALAVVQGPITGEQRAAILSWARGLIPV